MIEAVKLIFNNRMSTFLETFQLEIPQLFEELMRKLLVFFTGTEHVGNKRLRGFVQGRLVEDEKSFLNLFGRQD